MVSPGNFARPLTEQEKKDAEKYKNQLAIIARLQERQHTRTAAPTEVPFRTDRFSGDREFSLPELPMPTGAQIGTGTPLPPDIIPPGEAYPTGSRPLGEREYSWEGGESSEAFLALQEDQEARLRDNRRKAIEALEEAKYKRFQRWGTETIPALDILHRNVTQPWASFLLGAPNPVEMGLREIPGVGGALGTISNPAAAWRRTALPKLPVVGDYFGELIKSREELQQEIIKKVKADPFAVVQPGKATTLLREAGEEVKHPFAVQGIAELTSPDNWIGLGLIDDAVGGALKIAAKGGIQGVLHPVASAQAVAAAGAQVARTPLQVARQAAIAPALFMTGGGPGGVRKVAGVFNKEAVGKIGRSPLPDEILEGSNIKAIPETLAETKAAISHGESVLKQRKDFMKTPEYKALPATEAAHGYALETYIKQLKAAIKEVTSEAPVATPEPKVTTISRKKRIDTQLTKLREDLAIEIKPGEKFSGTEQHTTRLAIGVKTLQDMLDEGTYLNQPRQRAEVESVLADVKKKLHEAGIRIEDEVGAQNTLSNPDDAARYGVEEAVGAPVVDPQPTSALGLWKPVELPDGRWGISREGADSKWGTTYKTENGAIKKAESLNESLLNRKPAERPQDIKPDAEVQELAAEVSADLESPQIASITNNLLQELGEVTYGVGSADYLGRYGKRRAEFERVAELKTEEALIEDALKLGLTDDEAKVLATGLSLDHFTGLLAALKYAKDGATRTGDTLLDTVKQKARVIIPFAATFEKAITGVRGRVIDEVHQYSPEVRAAILDRSRALQSQIIAAPAVVQVVHNVFMRLPGDVKGTPISQLGDVQNIFKGGQSKFLVSKYDPARLDKTKFTEGVEEKVGTLQDFLRFPALYNLGQHQKVWENFALLWKEVTDAQFAKYKYLLGDEHAGLDEIPEEVLGIWFSNELVATNTSWLPTEKAMKEAGTYGAEDKALRELTQSQLGKGLARRAPAVVTKRQTKDARAALYRRTARSQFDLEMNSGEMLNKHSISMATLAADIIFLDSLASGTGSLGRIVGKKGKKTRKTGVTSSSVKMVPFKYKGMTWHLTERAALDAEKILTINPSGMNEQVAAKAIAELRAVLLNFDASIIGGRQGLLSLGANPFDTVRDLRDVQKYFSTPEGKMEFYAEHLQGMIDASRYGLGLGETPMGTPTGVFKTGADKPLIEKFTPLEKLNHLQFAVMLPIWKYHLYQRNLTSLLDIKNGVGVQGFLHSMPGLGDVLRRTSGDMRNMPDAQLKQIAADAANNFLGGVERARYTVHTQGALRQLVLLVENWTRAQAGLVINAPKFSAKGVLARKLLVKEIALGVGLANLVSLTTGRELNIDPRSQYFGKLNIPGVGWISVLPHASILRSAARAIGGVPGEGSLLSGIKVGRPWEDDPVGFSLGARDEGEYGYKDSLIAQRINALGQFGAGRMSHVTRTGIDLIKGEDFAGREITGFAAKVGYTARELMPIPLQAAIENVQLAGLGRDTFIEIPISFIGMDVSRGPVNDELETLAHKMGILGKGHEWHELPRNAKGEVQNSPEGRLILSRRGETPAERKRVIDRKYYDNQLIRDDWVKRGYDSKGRVYDGDVWRDDFYKGGKEKVALMKGYYKGIGVNFAEPKTDKEIALAGYFDLFDEYTGEGDVFDGAGFAEASDNYLAGLGTKGMRNYVLNSLHPSDTPMVKEWRNVHEAMQPYLGLPRMLAKIFERIPQHGAVVNQYVNARSSAEKNRLRRESPIIKVYQNLVDSIRKEMVKNSPLLAAFRERWYGARADPATKAARDALYQRFIDIAALIDKRELAAVQSGGYS